jgi:hypothetical protein
LPFSPRLHFTPPPPPPELRQKFIYLLHLDVENRKGTLL